jgi:hypothetical protein
LIGSSTRTSIVTITKEGVAWSVSTNNGADDMTPKEFRKYLDQQIKQAGGLRELARQTGLDPASISRVANGDEIPSDYFLDKFGFKRRITIVKK